MISRKQRNPSMTDVVDIRKHASAIPKTVSEAVQDDNDQRTEDSVVQSEEYRQYTGGSRDQYFGCGLYPQGRL